MGYKARNKITTVINHVRNFEHPPWSFFSSEPKMIEVLFERLEKYTLDPRFEEYGDFMLSSQDGDIPRGWVRLWGNFYDLSSVYSIDTNDPVLIKRYIAAVKANKDTVAYKEAKAARLEERRLREERLQKGQSIFAR